MLWGMEYVSRVPRPPLDGLIDDLYYLAGASPYARLTLPPAPSALLIVNLGAPFRIRGATDTETACYADGCVVTMPTRAWEFGYPPWTRSVGVHFKPWVGTIPQAGPVHPHSGLLRDLLTGEQPANHAHGLLQMPHPLFLGRPRLARDVLVHRLTAAQCGPDPTGEHLRERPQLVREDDRVVTGAGDSQGADGELGPREGRSEPGPGVAGVALPTAPGREVVGAHRHREASLFSVLDVGQQLAR